MRSINYGQATIEVLVDRHSTSSKGSSPLGPLQLQNAVHIADCIVFGDDSLVLNRKHQIQVLEPAGYKRRASLGCGNGEFTIEFLDVFFAEEPIRLFRASDPGQAQLLWLPPLPGA